MKSIFTLLIICMASFAYAQPSQYFMPPVDDDLIASAREVFAVTLDGDTVRGRMTGSLMMGGQIRSLNIKDDDGNKYKFKAAEVKVVGVKATNFMNRTSAMSAPNMPRLMDQDFKKIMNREWIIFDQALLPKKDKYALMQLLNPGFDSKIKVYINPNAGESAQIEVSGFSIQDGGDDTSYLVVKDGERAEIFKKKNYNNTALTELYTDCPDFEEAYSGERFWWSNFSEHVLFYDKLCD